MKNEILDFNKKQTPVDKNVCTILMQEINKVLPQEESKIWHAHPVWFLDGNPVAGYVKLKDGIRLMFWSGQSFDEKSLAASGSFKAAVILYTEVGQINIKDLKRWLKKSKEIQWDYKNIVKRKGVLKRLV